MEIALHIRDRKTNYGACQHCGGLLNKGIKFCSPKCKGLSERISITTNCAICNTSFTHTPIRCKTAKYCSNTCRYKSYAKIGTIVLPCDWCGQMIRKSPSHIRKNNFCSMPCRSSGMSRVQNGKRHAIFSEDWSKCSRCGWDELPDTLVVHHKDRNNRNNAVENRQVFCWNCHMVEHFIASDGPYARGGFANRSRVKSYKIQRLAQ